MLLLILEEEEKWADTGEKVVVVVVVVSVSVAVAVALIVVIIVYNDMKHCTVL